MKSQSSWPIAMGANGRPWLVKHPLSFLDTWCFPMAWLAWKDTIPEYWGLTPENTDSWTVFYSLNKILSNLCTWLLAIQKVMSGFYISIGEQNFNHSFMVLNSNFVTKIIPNWQGSSRSSQWALEPFAFCIFAMISLSLILFNGNSWTFKFPLTSCFKSHMSNVISIFYSFLHLFSNIAVNVVPITEMILLGLLSAVSLLNSKYCLSGHFLLLFKNFLSSFFSPPDIIGGLTKSGLQFKALT